MSFYQNGEVHCCSELWNSEVSPGVWIRDPIVGRCTAYPPSSILPTVTPRSTESPNAVDKENVATRYWLDGLGYEYRWGARLSATVQAGLYNVYCVSHPRVKRPVCDVDHPTRSSAEVKERVQL